MKNPYEDHFKKVKKSKKVRKSEPPVIPILVLLLLSFGLGWGYQNIDKVESYLGKIEIGMMGAALAQAEKNQTQGAKVENFADGKAAADPARCPDAIAHTPEEISHFSKLSERKKQLDLRENELNALEEELHKQRAEVESQIAKLERVRGEIGSVLQERVEIDETRVTKLVDFYSSMKPKQAAEIFNDLNENLAVEVLGRMKKKNAAEIMNLLEPKKAKILSEMFTGYKRR